MPQLPLTESLKRAQAHADKAGRLLYYEPQSYRTHFIQDNPQAKSAAQEKGLVAAPASPEILELTNEHPEETKPKRGRKKADDDGETL